MGFKLTTSAWVARWFSPPLRSGVCQGTTPSHHAKPHVYPFEPWLPCLQNHRHRRDVGHRRDGHDWRDKLVEWRSNVAGTSPWGTGLSGDHRLQRVSDSPRRRQRHLPGRAVHRGLVRTGPPVRHQRPRRARRPPARHRPSHHPHCDRRHLVRHHRRVPHPDRRLPHPAQVPRGRIVSYSKRTRVLTERLMA